MSEQRIGTCSICGGDVVGWQGGWWGIMPPPVARCRNCQATIRADVIDMVPASGKVNRETITTTTIGPFDDEEKKHD